MWARTVIPRADPRPGSTWRGGAHRHQTAARRPRPSRRARRPRPSRPLRLAPHERQRDRPERGGDDAAAEASDDALAEPQLVAGLGRRRQAQPAQMAVGLAPPVQPRDGLLADVQPLVKLTARSLRPASCGIVVSSMSSPKRGRPDSTRRISTAGSETAPRRARQRRGQPLGVGRVADQVDATSVRTASASMPSILTGALACSSRVVERRPRQTPRRAAGPISDSSPRSTVRLCSSTS